MAISTIVLAVIAAILAKRIDDHVFKVPCAINIGDGAVKVKLLLWLIVKSVGKLSIKALDEIGAALLQEGPLLNWQLRSLELVLDISKALHHHLDLVYNSGLDFDAFALCADALDEIGAALLQEGPLLNWQLRSLELVLDISKALNHHLDLVYNSGLNFVLCKLVLDILKALCHDLDAVICWLGFDGKSLALCADVLDEIGAALLHDDPHLGW